MTVCDFINSLLVKLAGNTTYGGSNVWVVIALYLLVLLISVQFVTPIRFVSEMAWRQLTILSKAFFGRAPDPKSTRHGGELVSGRQCFG